MAHQPIDFSKFFSMADQDGGGLAALGNAISETIKDLPGRETGLRLLLSSAVPVLEEQPPLKWIDPGVRYWLASELVEQGRLVEAEVEYLRVIEAGQQAEKKEVVAWAYFQLAELQAATASALAESSYRQAIAQAQGHDLRYLRAIAQANLGYYLGQRRHLKAKEELKKGQQALLDLTKEDSFSSAGTAISHWGTVLYGLGMASYLLGVAAEGNYEKTEEYYRAWRAWNRMIEERPEEDGTKPHLAATYNGRGNVWLEWKDEARAEKDLRQAYELDEKRPEREKDPFIRTSLGDFFRTKKQKDNGQAETYYRLALETDATHARAHVGLALAALDKGDHDRAIKHCQDAIAIRPYYAEAHAVLARIETAKRGQNWWEWWGQGWRKLLAGALGVAILLTLALPLVAPRWGWVSVTERGTEITQEMTTSPGTTDVLTKITTKTTETVKPPSIPTENLVVAGLLLAVYLLPAVSRFKAGATGVEIDLGAGTGKAQAQVS